MNRNLFARWVEENRAKRGWTRAQLAQRLGIRRDGVYQMEMADEGRIPRFSTIEKLCTVFGLSVDEERWNLGHKKECLTAMQTEVLTGLLLGDGHLCRPTRTRNAYLTVGRTGRDHLYQQWTADIFSNFSPWLSLSNHHTPDGRTHSVSTLGTRCSNAFTEFHEIWYSGRKKILPPSLTLSPLTIAVWLADDGYVRGRRKIRGMTPTIGRPSFYVEFATCGFSSEENNRLCAMLNERYGGGFSVGRYGKYLKIRAATVPTKALLREINRDFPPLDRKSSIWRMTSDLWVNEPPCPWCGSENVWRQGRNRGGTPRWSCNDCKRYFIQKRYTETSKKPKRHLCAQIHDLPFSKGHLAR